MSPEQINIAIAEVCGWKATEFYADGSPRIWTNSQGCCLHWENHNYCDDLNAMHDAEKTLDVEEKKGAYQENLHAVSISSLEGLTIGDAWYLQIHATARQRAEAFLRVKGLWRD